ncbi:subtilisin-like protease [Abortiporus biennis]|nr:subtilisin-like protease [Abortiporus biennis]
MASKWFSLLSAFFIYTAQATVPLSSVSKETSLANTIPGQYIVELDNVGDLSNGKRLYTTAHTAFYSALERRAIDFQVQREFNTPGVFVGASVSLTASQDLRDIASLPGVKAIRPVVSIKGPKPIDKRVVKPGDSGVPDGESTHIMTGVDKVHAQGVTGKGIKIGIIDTGIDYNHPVLGGGFGPGHKVIGGYDLVGDAFTGSNTPVPDNDPLDECNGHGTHVAGIIGANPGNEFNISGVAYDASLASYRVFGCDGSTPDDIIIDALLRGYNDGMDILTLSLGGADGWSESSSAVVASNLVDKGKVVTIAAGNDGGVGTWYASAPGTGKHVISVGSVDNTVIPAQNAIVAGIDHAPILYYSALPLPITETLPIYAVSTDTTIANDACDPLPDSTPDLSNFIVIVKRGTCTFVQKLTNIAAKGARFSLIYNNGGSIGISAGNFTTALISEGDGDFLVQQFVAKSNLTLSFPQTGGSSNAPNPTGGLMSSFSTYGPSYDMFFKPAVSAPGGGILSTLPLKLGGWGVESGTSMATPFTAGSAGLILQAKGKVDPLQTLSQQGAGLVDVFTAINTKTVVSPSEILLNDTSNAPLPLHTITIKNTSPNAVTYKIGHVPAGTANSIDTTTGFAVEAPVVLNTNHASVSLSQSKVTVRPGGTALILATILPPRNLDASVLPVYSGYIVVSNGQETLRSSYLGVVGSLKKQKVIDTSDAFFGIPLPALLDKEGNPQSNISAYTLAGDDAPTVLFRLDFGTPLLRVDLVDKNLQLTPTIKKRSWWWSWWSSLTNFDSFDKVKTLGALAELDYTPRNADAATAADNGWNTVTLDGTFADGTSIPNGDYKILVRALKVTGNPANENDFESWLSPAFTVART